MRTFFLTRVLPSIVLGATALANADMVQLRVSVENLVPQNSIAFAPLRIGFCNGTYDSFDEGQPASQAIISIAEGGSGSDWFPAFAAAEPNAQLGTVVPNPPGPLLPGGNASAEFTVDTSLNRYFTFAAMVVPSNDYFIGNDNPMAYELFDVGGNLNITTINLVGGNIWNAGSELTDPAAAAFLVIGNNDLRTPENGVVGHDFADLATFDGLQTAAGYTFDSQLKADLGIYRISFEVVPEPATALLMGLVGLTVAACRRLA